MADNPNEEAPPEPQPQPAPQDPFANVPQPTWDLVEKGGRPDGYETREHPH